VAEIFAEREREARELRRREADWKYIGSLPPRLRAALIFYIETGELYVAARARGQGVEEEGGRLEIHRLAAAAHKGGRQAVHRDGRPTPIPEDLRAGAGGLRGAPKKGQRLDHLTPPPPPGRRSSTSADAAESLPTEPLTAAVGPPAGPPPSPKGVCVFAVGPRLL